MSHSIGQIIKKLRKERNYTQEELAELLNVSSQAVSKWENETSMPDISQIVPLSSVFGVSTDVLFGTYGASDDEEVRDIIRNAWSLNRNETEQGKLAYDILQEGLLRYPNNMTLLMHSLECGIALAYPENDCYDEIHGNEIYQECIRQANIVISYGKNAGDILRAHMIMVLLHSAYGDSHRAREHAESFPVRSDMTLHGMSAYISHAEKNYPKEAKNCRIDFLYHFEAMFDNIVQLGESYRCMKKYDDALKVFESIFSLINIIFAGESIMPPKHCRDRGDVHALIAQTYLEMNDSEKALDWLEKMVDYDINIRSQFKNDMHITNPFLRDLGEGFTFYYIPDDNKERLLNKLRIPEFDSLKNNERFISLIERANNML